jgi:hypothetical protein
VRQRQHPARQGGCGDGARRGAPRRAGRFVGLSRSPDGSRPPPAGPSGAEPAGGGRGAVEPVGGGRPGDAPTPPQTGERHRGRWSGGRRTVERAPVGPVVAPPCQRRSPIGPMATVNARCRRLHATAGDRLDRRVVLPDGRSVSSRAPAGPLGVI